MRGRGDGARYLLFGGIIVAVGYAVSNVYELQLLTIIGIHTLLALGLNMLMGYAGQISLGHAAFFGLGAYGSGVLTATFGWSPWGSCPVVLTSSALIAYLVGRPTLKLSGYYLAMGTLGLGIISSVIFREWSSVTGGASGLVGIPPIDAGGVCLSLGRNAFWLVWTTVFFSFAICERIVQSRIGRALRAIRDGEGAAAASGIDTSRLKVQVFSLSAVFAAMAGFLYAHLVGFISPSSFDFMMSIRMVTMVVIGGMASIWGALLGASVITLLPEWLHVFSDYEMIVFGLILMVVMIFMPEGLTCGLKELAERLWRSGGDRARDS